MKKSLRSVLLRILFVIFLAMALPAFSAVPFINSKSGIPSLAPLLQDVTPAVVNISVKTRSAIEDNPLFRDPFFRRFFEFPDQAARPERSAGSGVIVGCGQGLRRY